jgi:hypothetical protein
VLHRPGRVGAEPRLDERPAGLVQLDRGRAVVVAGDEADGIGQPGRERAHRVRHAGQHRRQRVRAVFVQQAGVHVPHPRGRGVLVVAGQWPAVVALFDER